MGIEWGIGSGEGVEMRRRATPDAARSGSRSGSGDVESRVGLWHRLIGCPNARFRQGFPVARVWTEELGPDLVSLGECVLMAVMKCQ